MTSGFGFAPEPAPLARAAKRGACAASPPAAGCAAFNACLLPGHGPLSHLNVVEKASYGKLRCGSWAIEPRRGPGGRGSRP